MKTEILKVIILLLNSLNCVCNIRNITIKTLTKYLKF